MEKQQNYSEITPIDLANPFRNPTEEPDYTPDYRDILPNAELPETRLLLLPPPDEKRAIRRYYSLVFFTLLFAFFASSAAYAALSMIIGAALRFFDAQKTDVLPENYMYIVQQYMDDSSIRIAVNLIAFLCCNLISLWVGCKITGITLRDCIGKKETVRKCSIGRVIFYALIGLWIQMLAGYAGDAIITLCSKTGIPLYLPELSGGTDPLKIACLAIYGCIVAPITEELLLRGFALKNLSRVSQRFGIICSALLFGIMHENLPQFLFTFPLGILLAYITIRHNSLLPAVLVHMTVNTAGVLLDLLHSFLPMQERMVTMIYSLAILALGSICFLYFAGTERLPDNTPHQSTRTARIAVTSPLLWLLIGVHIAASFMANYLDI